MPLIVNWHVRCDQCDARLHARPSQFLACQAACNAGWLKGNMYGIEVFLCPECQSKPLPDWWPDSTGTRFWWEET